MTDSGTSPHASAAPLGPFQRGAASAPPHHLAVTTDKASGATIFNAARRVLDAMPALHAELVSVASMRTPWQRLAQTDDRSLPEEGGWQIRAGATTVCVTEGAGHCRLTVSTLPAFADAFSLVSLVHLIDQDLRGTPVLRDAEPFAVENAHLEMLRAGELSEEERYWRARREETAGTGTRIADAFPAPGNGAGQAGVRLARPLVAAADALAAAAGGGFADVAFLALALLLHRLGATADSMERTVDARSLMGLTGAVGVFSHAVPIRCEIDPAQTVLQTLRAAVARRVHEDGLVGCPSPSQDGGPPEVLFAGNHFTVRLPDGWQLQDAPAPPGRMSFAYTDNAAGHELVVRVADDHPTDPGLMARLWHAVLVNMAAAPDALVETISATDADLLGELSRELATASGRPAGEDICTALARHGASNASAPAVYSQDGTWTFADLLGRVHATASRLSQAGPGDVVAVVGRTDRPETLVGILAVLWLGAVFMPIDPDEPAARVTDALTRSGAVAVLSAAPEFSTCLGVPVMAVQGADTDGPLQPADVEPARVTGQSTAYVLRTSGSTGAPKLVAVSRAALANYLRWVTDSLVPHVLADRALPGLSPAVFDASFKQTLGMIASGRPVWLPKADPRDLTALLRELSERPGSIAVNCVPSYWSALLEAASESPRPRIEQVLLGGEPVSAALLQRTRQVFPGAQVWNLYGPTEATATATMGRLDIDGAIHVGDPIAHAVIVVLDPYGSPVPHGVAGEIAIAGPGVAQGYLGGSPEGAEARSPFFTLTAGDLSVDAYRTGDYGWIAADGTLRLLGRRDNQVKVNGWRVELGEIESAAERLEGVSRALVVLDAGAMLRLFIIGIADPHSVRESLAALLPTPMVPSTVHAVEEFPVLPTGKVNRAGLLASMTRPAEEDPLSYDSTQLVVATEWRALLGGWPRVTDEFFECGGHSLMLAQLVNRLRQRGFAQLSVRHVIRRPTVESIAAVIRQAEDE